MVICLGLKIGRKYYLTLHIDNRLGQMGAPFWVSETMTFYKSVILDI